MQRLRDIFEILKHSPEGIKIKKSVKKYSRATSIFLNPLYTDEAALQSITIEPITTENVLKAIEHTKPSAKNLSVKYLDWQKQYESA